MDGTHNGRVLPTNGPSTGLDAPGMDGTHIELMPFVINGTHEKEYPRKRITIKEDTHKREYPQERILSISLCMEQWIALTMNGCFPQSREPTKDDTHKWPLFEVQLAHLGGFKALVFLSKTEPSQTGIKNQFFL